MLKLFFWFLMPLTLWFAAEGEGGEGESDSSDDPLVKKDGDGAGKEEETLSFTQSQLDVLFGQRAASASGKAKSDLLAELGVENIADAKALLVEAEKARKAQMSELEQAQEEIRLAKEAQATAETEAQNREALANERLMQSAIIAEASKAEHKLRPEAIKDLWAFVDKSKLEVLESNEVTGAEEAIKAAIKDRPYMIVDETPSPGTTNRQKRTAMQQRAVNDQQPVEEQRPIVNF